LQLLVKHKLLVSMKGPTGGYKLNRPADEICLLEIVEAIDGLDIFRQCGIGFRKCNPDKPCPIHTDYKKIRDKVYKLFEEKTLVALNEEIKNGQSMGEIVKPSEK
jgi:Rrf2 family protein